MLDIFTSPAIGIFDKFFMLLAFFIPAFALISIIIIVVASIKQMRFNPKCQVCNKFLPDVLSQGKQTWYLCKIHLLPKFSELFLKNTFNVVMVEFTSDSFKNGDITYSYYPISEFKDYIFADTQQVLKQLLDSIKSQNCAKCGSRAYILFVNKDDAVWRKEGYRSGPYEYIIPSAEYLTKGRYLCNEHALDQAKHSLQTYSKPIIIDGGVWLPYKEDGFLTAAEV